MRRKRQRERETKREGGRERKSEREGGRGRGRESGGEWEREGESEGGRERERAEILHSTFVYCLWFKVIEGWEPPSAPWQITLDI